MAELKTKKNDGSVTDFLDRIEDEKRRKDCYAIVEMMQAATQAEPRMWGTSIIGFGDYRYKYSDGRENDWFLTGFAPRKNDLTLYLIGGLARLKEELQALGKYKTGKGCLYIKKLEDVNTEVLQKMIRKNVEAMKAQ